MARVTVEDCVTRVPNRFELVMLAAQRGRNIGAGAPLTLDRDNDKNAVVALREIADANVDLKELENGLIRGLQTVVEADEPEGEEIDLLPPGEDIGGEVVEESAEEVLVAIGEVLNEERGEARASEEMREDELHIEDEAGAVLAGDDEAGPTDVVPPDAGPADVDPTDTGSTDVDPPDAGPADVDPTDAGSTDVDPTDTGSTDSGLIDGNEEPETF